MILIDEVFGNALMLPPRFYKVVAEANLPSFF
jgi:hypothetical protein